MATEQHARIGATWWDNTDPDEISPPTEDAELIVQYDNEMLYIEGLRDGFYLALDANNLFAAMAAVGGGEAELVEHDRYALQDAPSS
jgi:hypothetical protein